MSDFYSKLVNLGITLKKTSGKEVHTTCPKCSHTRSHKNDPCLFVNIDAGAYKCHHCGWEGNVRSGHTPKKVYVKPQWSNITKISDGLVAYWAGRGISQQTLIQVKMNEGQHFMPQTYREELTMQWPYLRDGEVVNVKYRGQMLVQKINKQTLQPEQSIEKIFTLVKDAEKIFWNLDAIKESEECLITEGEPDGMSFIEAGYLPVVSVPNGATKANNNLQYLDNCIDYFENKKKIYIGVDNDEAGRALAAELVRRLGAERCWLVNYGDCKDGNEYLIKHGKLALPILLNWAKPAQISGIVDIDDTWNDVLDIWKNGLKPGLQVNVKQIDELYSYPPGFMTVVTGKPNGGKGPLTRYQLVRMAVLHGTKTALFCPEDEPIALHITNIISVLIGKSFNPKYGAKITIDEVNSAKDFIREHFFFISKGRPGGDGELALKKFSVDEILAVAKKLVIRHGINFLVIDPWNKIRHSKKGDNWDQKEYISDQLDLILDFGEANGVHPILIVHPTKIYKDKVSGKYPVVTLNDCAGAAEFETKTPMGFSVYRDYDKGTTSMYVLKMKHNHHGQIGFVDFTYDVLSGRYNVVGCIPDKGNWLITPPLNQGYNEPSNVLAEGSPVIVAETTGETNDMPF